MKRVIRTIDRAGVTTTTRVDDDAPPAIITGRGGNLFPQRIEPPLKELPLEVRQDANMVLASRQALRTNMDDAQTLTEFVPKLLIFLPVLLIGFLPFL